MKRKILKEFCNAYKRKFGCPDTECTVCPFLIFVYAIHKNQKKRCTMNYAIKKFMDTGIEREVAKKIVEEAIGIPLEIVHSVLRENE